MESDEFADLQKFLSILALKTASVIIGARTESPQKHSVPCNPSPTSADWFGLAVRDQPKLKAELKELSRDSRVIVDQPFAVEILAQLPSKEEIPLEYWWLWLDPENVDKDVRVKYVVYNRMAILLKSVIVVLRASPINRMIRQNDYFKYSHRIFLGQPNLSQLKAVGKNFQVGPLKTPFGSIYFSGACREAAFSEGSVPRPLSDGAMRAFHPQSSPTKIHLERIPERTSSPKSFSPSEKFRASFSPTSPAFSDFKRNAEAPLSFAELHCVGAFADTTRSSSDSDDDSYEIPDSAFENLVPPLDDDNLATKTSAARSILKDLSNIPKPEVNSNRPSLNAAFHSDVEIISNISPADDGFDDGDDFLEIDQLRPAFAPAKGRSNPGTHDLAGFFQDCQLAPHQLPSLDKRNESVAHTVRSLSENLVGMEAQLLEFDRFVDDLRQVGGESSWIMTLSSGH